MPRAVSRHPFRTVSVTFTCSASSIHADGDVQVSVALAGSRRLRCGAGGTRPVGRPRAQPPMDSAGAPRTNDQDDPTIVTIPGAPAVAHGWTQVPYKQVYKATATGR